MSRTFWRRNLFRRWKPSMMRSTWQRRGAERTRSSIKYRNLPRQTDCFSLKNLDLKKIEAMSVNNKVRTRLLSSPSIITKISIYFLRFILAQTFQICSSVKRTLSRTLRGRQRTYYPQLFYLWFIKHFSGWLWLKRAYNVGSLRDAWLMIEICISVFDLITRKGFVHQVTEIFFPWFCLSTLC